MSSILSKIGAFFGRRPAAPTRATPGRRETGVQARYDNAMWTDENRRNWFMSDYFSAKAANSFQVRRMLRNRSRYECSNNPYMWGICNDNASDLVNKGPTLKITTPNDAFNKAYESHWKDWCAEVDFVEKVRTIKLAKTIDGEGFLILKTVRDQEHPVQLYPVDIEADQITTPAPKNIAELWVDGLTLHPITGRPTSFHVLKHHPGDMWFPDFNPLAVQEIGKRHVIHWFPKFRPGQVRGVPIFTPSLDLWAECRAFRKATLSKAQVAANIAGVAESDAPASDEADEFEEWKKVQTDRGTIMTLPSGLRFHQYTTGDPSTTYAEFQHECLGEACRPLSYPVNRALGTSQLFNFSSAKLDHGGYQDSLLVERSDADRIVCDHLLREYHREAVLVGLCPPGPVPAHEWHWPMLPILDLAAETDADLRQINGGTKTWHEFWAKRGRDWREAMAQQKQELDEIKRLGLVFGEPLTKRESVTTDDPNSPPSDPTTVKKKAPKEKAAA